SRDGRGVASSNVFLMGSTVRSTCCFLIAFAVLADCSTVVKAQSDTPTSPESSITTADPPPTVDEKAVRKIVAAYLKEQEDKKKKEEEQKRLDEATIGIEIGKDLKMSSAWRDGVHWQTADGAYKFYVGGRVDFDNTWYAAPHSVNNSIGQFNSFLDPNL